MVLIEMVLLTRLCLLGKVHWIMEAQDEKRPNHGWSTKTTSESSILPAPWASTGFVMVLTGTMSNLKSVTILVSYRIFGRGEEPGLT